MTTRHQNTEHDTTGHTRNTTPPNTTPLLDTGGSSRRFWGRPTWRSDPSQGTPKTKNSLDLAHYFLGSGPKSRTKIKYIKKESKKVRLQVPGLSWKSMVSPVGPRFVLRGCDLICWALVCHEDIWFVLRCPDSFCEDLIRPAHGRSHHHGHYGQCPYKFRNAQKLVRNARSSCQNC